MKGKEQKLKRKTLGDYLHFWLHHFKLSQPVSLPAATYLTDVLYTS